MKLDEAGKMVIHSLGFYSENMEHDGIEAIDRIFPIFKQPHLEVS